MKFKVTLQRKFDELWWNTDYWYLVNMPNNVDISLMPFESLTSGYEDILLWHAMRDKSLLPNDGFRFSFGSEE